LELADWELKEALQSAKEDNEWEKEEGHSEELKSGQIGVHINFKGGKPLLNLKGIGKSKKDGLTRKETTDEEKSESSKPKGKVVVYSSPPAIATKSVLAQDLFNVSILRTKSNDPGQGGFSAHNLVSACCDRRLPNTIASVLN